MCKTVVPKDSLDAEIIYQSYRVGNFCSLCQKYVQPAGWSFIAPDDNFSDPDAHG